MFSITVLSPHRDDAAFSVGLALQRWSEVGAAISVTNFFTWSAYAPCVASTDPGTVSSIRKREDRLTLRHIARGISVRDKGLLDAPLRLGIQFGQIFKPETQRLISAEDISSIVRIIDGLARTGLVLAPLALGDHVDHILVSRSARMARRVHAIAFYEDLPYRTWTPDEAVEGRVREIEQQTHTPLAPAIIRTERAARRKQALAARYQSQITPSEAGSIAAMAAHYGGERIWCPVHNKTWKSMLRYASVA